MSDHGFAFFDTAIGRCAIAWRGRVVAGMQLPERREHDTRARLLHGCPDAKEGAPPPDVQRAVDGIVGLLRGETADLSSVVLDMDRVPPFHRRVYEVARTIPPGATLSYGDIAKELGAPGAARAVGQALGRNPFAILVPCHRVLAAGGKVGGFSANGGITTKLRLLTLEGGMANGTASSSSNGATTFSFDTNAAIGHLVSRDPVLGRLVQTVGPFRMRLDETSSVFAALAEAIVYQQLNGKAAATIFARLAAVFPNGHRGFTAEQVLRASDEKLRAAGLSRNKLLSIRDLAQKTKNGCIPTFAEIGSMDDETIIERLTEVRGIGRWTAEMLLMFRLGRADVLPADDYGIRKGFSVAFKTRELPSRQTLEKRASRWRPYRTVASWYLWRAAERAALAAQKTP